MVGKDSFFSKKRIVCCKKTYAFQKIIVLLTFFLYCCKSLCHFLCSFYLFNAMFLLKILGKILLFFSGWKIKGKLPQNVPKTVMIAAPHTSNWDFFYTIVIFSALGVRIRFLGKKSLFKFPLGMLMRFFGGIPVDRSQRNNFVSTAADMIKNAKEIILLVPVEGTRSYTENWRSGFYYIAQEAGVPISLGFLDYAKKEGGFFSDLFYPTGNYVEDLEKLQLFYKDVQGKYPQNSSLYKKFGSKTMIW
jgi:1-acyl-sn-glycerol-3-phosphate acyltransferase